MVASTCPRKTGIAAGLDKSCVRPNTVNTATTTKSAHCSAVCALVRVWRRTVEERSPLSRRVDLVMPPLDVLYGMPEERDPADQAAVFLLLDGLLLGLFGMVLSVLDT